MLTSIILALILGVIAGVFTGLSPGIHINLVAAVVVSLTSFLLKITSIESLIVFIVAMGITHSFIDFIPSIFLGAPNSEASSLSILPAHQLLLEGKGYLAVLLSSYGGFTSIFTSILFLPIFLFLLPQIYDSINKIVPLILIISSLIIIFSEKDKINSVIVFLLSGILGLAVLNININQPFLPLFTGLFGISSLIISLKNKTIIPLQSTKISLDKKEFFQPITASVITSPICAFIPGLSSGHSAAISSNIIDSTNKKFIILLGATNTSVLIMSFFTLFSISKSRTGLSVAINQIIPNLNNFHLKLMIITIIISGIISFLLSLYIGKIFAKNFHKINYSKLSFITIIFLIIFTSIISGYLGIIILISSTFLGIYCINQKIKRINLVACLIVPVIINYI